MVWGGVAAGLLAIVIGHSGLRASRHNTKKHLLTIARLRVACGHHPRGEIAVATPGLRPQIKHVYSYKNNSYQRLPHKRQSQIPPKMETNPPQYKYTAPALVLLSSTGLPPMPFDPPSSVDAPTASVCPSPDSATRPPNRSPLPVLGAFK